MIRTKNTNIPHSRPTLSTNEARAVETVIKNGHISHGACVAQFEDLFGRDRAVAVNSGTSALHIALLALGVKRGDEVIIPSYVCTAVANAVLYTGATPRIVDVNYGDGNIAIAATKKACTRKTKAIIVPHMFGSPADIKELRAIGVPIIEDCAQAIGATYAGKPVGSFGDVSIFSFYATKMITTGEGGMVVSRDRKMINTLRDLRDYDNRSTYRLRYNYAMTDIQAALGIVQLTALPEFIARRRMIAEKYSRAFSTTPFELPTTATNKKSVFFRYVIKVPAKRDIFLAALRKNGVIAMPPVFKPLHTYLRGQACPVTDQLMKTAISLPLYPSLTNIECRYIIKTVIDQARTIY